MSNEDSTVNNTFAKLIIMLEVKIRGFQRKVIDEDPLLFLGEVETEVKVLFQYADANKISLEGYITHFVNILEGLEIIKEQVEEKGNNPYSFLNQIPWWDISRAVCVIGAIICTAIGNAPAGYVFSAFIPAIPSGSGSMLLTSGKNSKPNSLPLFAPSLHKKTYIPGQNSEFTEKQLLATQQEPQVPSSKLYDDVKRKSSETASRPALSPSHNTSLHNIRDGIVGYVGVLRDWVAALFEEGETISTIETPKEYVLQPDQRVRLEMEARAVEHEGEVGKAHNHQQLQKLLGNATNIPQITSNLERIGIPQAMNVPTLRPDNPLPKTLKAHNIERTPSRDVIGETTYEGNTTKCLFFGIIEVSARDMADAGVLRVECPECLTVRSLLSQGEVVRFPSHGKRKTRRPHREARWIRREGTWELAS